jgi:hypothetical protein
MLDDLDLTGIQDERARALIVRLLNLIEDLSADLRAAQEEIQRLRDENNRLKGEQGKPTVKPNAVPPDPTESFLGTRAAAAGGTGQTRETGYHHH